MVEKNKDKIERLNYLNKEREKQEKELNFYIEEIKK